jgi:HPt (histidine-containing phosphotransfer) domain-containing protein
MSAAVEAMMKQLSSEYRDRLPARMAEVQRLSGLDDEESLVVLRRELHTLAGSASTFGLPELTLAARAAEQQLDAVLDHKAPLDRARFQTLLDSVRQAAGVPQA